jgi:hypothetical protein
MHEAAVFSSMHGLTSIKRCIHDAAPALAAQPPQMECSLAVRAERHSCVRVPLRPCRHGIPCGQASGCIVTVLRTSLGLKHVPLRHGSTVLRSNALARPLRAEPNTDLRVRSDCYSAVSDSPRPAEFGTSAYRPPDGQNAHYRERALPGDLDQAYLLLEQGGWAFGDRSSLELDLLFEPVRADPRRPDILARISSQLNVE